MNSSTTSPPVTLRQHLDAASMSALQWRAIALCFLINAIDGIDVLVMAFTASAVTKDWGLNNVVLGWLLSAGIIGMTVGSVFLAPLSDRWGRRPMVLASLAAAGAFMVATEWVNDPWTLGVLRFLTGIGIGCSIVNANVLTSEYANAKWRALAIGLQSVGFALGATLGGMMAAYLLKNNAWQDVFVWGGILTWITALLIAIGLPESLDQLLQGRHRNDQQRAHHLLERMGHGHLSIDRPTSSVKPNALQALRLLWGLGALRTWLLGGSFFALMFSFYFVTSWTPKLLEQAGLSADKGVAGGVLLHVGGMLGALALGVLASRWHLQRVAQSLMVLGVFALCAVIPATNWSLPAAIALGIAIGFLINGSIAGLYATTPQSFEAATRSSGVGMVLAFARLGGMASPVVAGHLLEANWSVSHLYWLYAGALLLAATFLQLFLKTQHHHA
ncbi:MFS transporter [Paenalcaligenes hominis]|uniref:MFS transporter n=1 Tax=Paenalcaligenes hominis TaxID=643674 RepID=A0A1U9K0S3_9BURK|nr:MFS transporter [Paenalcaligenes hominis]AQS51663.1 MFS transporter [Paenalcaligenes hominis]